MSFFLETFPSPIGDLTAVADEDALLMLEFSDATALDTKLQQYFSPHQIIAWNNPVLKRTRQELAEYFSGERMTFSIPYRYTTPTPFQQKAWDALVTIPYGETRSYQEQATLVGHPKAVRAIGGANNKNPILIIVPCHRVIGKSGKMIGYGWGTARKEWLLHHEQQHTPIS